MLMLTGSRVISAHFVALVTYATTFSFHDTLMYTERIFQRVQCILLTNGFIYVVLTMEIVYCMNFTKIF